MFTCLVFRRGTSFACFFYKTRDVGSVLFDAYTSDNAKTFGLSTSQSVKAFTVMKNAVFWNVSPCCSCKNRGFEETYRLHHQGDRKWRVKNSVSSNYVPSSPSFVTLMMEAIRSFETLILTRATRRHITEYSIIDSYSRGNFKSYILCDVPVALHITNVYSFGTQHAVAMEPSFESPELRHKALHLHFATRNLRLY
jgi:hypothetical protein